MTSFEAAPPLKLLALDGGGIRGLSELLVVKDVMHRLMFEENAKRKKNGEELLSVLPKPCDYFDLIGGTSTGGIIALMLGRLRMDVDTAIKHYDDLAKQVFADRKRWGDRKFKAETLERVIKSVVETVTGDPDAPLLEGNQAGVCRTFVCAMNAHNMNGNIPVLFRTYESHKVHLNCKIWEAARATSAAPTFFKRIKIGRKQPFIDGGLGRNNPSQVVLEEAEALFGARQIACFVSIGAGKPKVTDIKKPGFFQQIIPIDVVDALKSIAADCENTHQHMLCHFARLPNTYFRLNVEQGMQGIKFSESEKLSNVEAHTVNYLADREVESKLALLVSAIRVPTGQLPLEQLILPRPPIESAQHNMERKLCPPPVASFIGRKEILDKMRGYFESASDSQRVFVLHGLGGSGKSQLAFKFVQEFTCFSDVFYIDATNKQTLQLDLEAIAPGNVEQSADASLRWLASRRDGNWLLFFDNADDVNLQLKKFFPQCVFGNILVTTRNRELRVLSGRDADEKVAGMDHEDATNLLLHQARAEKSSQNKALAEEIVQELHHFALAVSQAGAYIYCHLSLSQYRDLYRHHRDQLLQRKGFQERDPYERAVYTTWRLSYDKLDTSARSLLQIFSILHHEGISGKMFEKAVGSQDQLEDSELQNKVTQLLNQLGNKGLDWSWHFGEVIIRLGSHSLIEYDHQNHTYSIHPLVQHWSRTTIEGNIQVMQKCVLGIIGLSISWTFNDEDYKYRRALLQHISKCRVSLNPEEIDPLILTRIGLVYDEQGHGTDAEVLKEVVTETTKQVLGDDHPSTLRSKTNLAATYWNQGRLTEAEAIQVVVVEKQKQVLGKNHPDTLTSMANLAATYKKQGRLTEAEALEVVVMEIRMQILGTEHPDTLMSLANLAATYRHQGRWTEAEKLDVEVIEKRNHVIADNLPSTVASMENLVSTYWKQGRLTEAAELEVVVIEKQKKLLGGDHPNTLTSIANLATIYWKQGRWTESEALNEEVMKKRKKILGDYHPFTLKSMGNLANTYRDQGRWSEAEALEVVVMEKMKWVLGENHPDTLRSMGNLAVTYQKQGRWPEAEALEVVVMEKRKQVLGDEHPDTLTSIANLAAMYRNQGRLTEAEALEMVT